jgi:hypothetical protein
MFDKHLNLTETIDALKAIRSIDLETAPRDELNQLILNLSKHIAIVTTIPVGRVIIRSISCKYLKNGPISIYPLRVSQLSFNPNAEVCGFNRASWQGETAFYGSVATDSMKPYHTSSFEVLNDLRDSDSEIDRETFVIGKWVVINELPLVHISGNLKNNELVSSSRYNSLYESISKYPDSIIPLKMIDSYLCSEFAKEVPNNEKWKYKVSAAYAAMIKKDSWPGILYPSLKTDGAGYNVVLFPDALCQFLKFERATLTTFYKRGMSIGNEITMEAIPDGDMLRWSEVYIHKMPPVMKRWYTGQSDDNSFDKHFHYENL